MTRGNQREIDRARAQARNAKSLGGDKREGSIQSRNMTDAQALQAKLAKKQEEAKKKKEMEDATASYNATLSGGGSSSNSNKNPKKK